MSDLVGNHKDRFSQDTAHYMSQHMGLLYFSLCIEHRLYCHGYHKVSKIFDTRNFAVIHKNIQTKRPYLKVFCQKLQMEKLTVKTLIRLIF